MTMPVLEARVLALIKSLKGPIPTHQHDYMQELCQVGEPGIALENFAEQLYEYYVRVDPKMIEEMEALGAQMGLDPRHFARLRELL